MASDTNPGTSNSENFPRLKIFGERALTDHESLAPVHPQEGALRQPSASTLHPVSARPRPSIRSHANTFPRQDLRPSYQPRTRPISTVRPGPYKIQRTRRDEHWSTEAGPSTLRHLLVPGSGTVVPQPTRGIPETTADADKPTYGEEGKTAVSNFYHSHNPHARD